MIRTPHRIGLLLVSFSLLLPVHVAAGPQWIEYGAIPCRYLPALGQAPDGTALLFGGMCGYPDCPGSNNTLLNDTWLYNASRNAWSRQAPSVSPSARIQASVAFAGAGRFLLFGGYDGSYGPRADTWLFDATAGIWTLLTPAASPPGLGGTAAMYLGDDRVLLFGGYTRSAPSGETWVFDVSDNTWTRRTYSTAPSARGMSAVAPLGDGLFVLFGGSDNSSRYGDTWIYDSLNDAWEQKIPLASPPGRMGAAMAPVGTDQVVLSGGFTGGYSNDTWIYDLGDNTWTEQPAGTLPPRFGHVMVRTLDGGVQMLLGLNPPGYPEYLADVWSFDPAAATWTDRTGPGWRHYGAAARVGEGKIVVYGGFAPFVPNGTPTDTKVFDVATGYWTTKSPVSNPGPRQYFAMAYAGEDRALLFGGYAPGRGAIGETWLYDLSEDSWTQIIPQGDSPRGGEYPAMAWAGDDKVVLFGGGGTDQTWVFDVSEAAWTRKSPSSHPYAGYGHSMAWAGGDKVVAFGAVYSWPGYESTWVYDLSDDQWQEIVPVPDPDPRYGTTMAWAGEDRVLLFGGSLQSGSFNGETWIYDSSDQTWTQQTLMPTPGPRGFAQMADLGDGRVVLQGGYLSFWDRTVSTWVYEDLPTNHPPALDPIGDRALLWKETLGFSAAASDPDGNGLTFALGDDAPPGATIDPSTGAFTWTPGPSDVGTHQVTIRVTDDGTPSMEDVETITITVGKRPTTLVYSGVATSQYSDVALLAATLADSGDGTPIAGVTIDFTVGSQSDSSGTNASGGASASIAIAQAQANVSVAASFAGDDCWIGSGRSGSFAITREDATITPSAGNPLSVKVNAPEGTAGPVLLCGEIKEVPDGSFGEISRAVPVSFSLVPVAGGPTITQVASTSGGGGTLTACVTLAGLPVNVYDVSIAIEGAHYTGSAVSLLAVYDPSLGFATGGGLVRRNGATATFGFVAKYLKSGNAQGSFEFVEHRPDGDLRVKSNALQSLSLVNNTAVIMGRANVNGAGNHLVRITVVDNGEPGSGDLFGLETWNGAGVPVPDLTFVPVTLSGGNIHLPKKQ